MVNGPVRWAPPLCALMASTSLAAPAWAQTGRPSVYQHVDANGVDLVDGSFNMALTEGSIGSGPGAIALVRYESAGGASDNLSVRFQRSTSGDIASITLTFGNRRESFSGAAAATSFVSGHGNGATLTKASASEYRYTAADGTVTIYGPPPLLGDVTATAFCSATNESNCSLIATQTTRPNGAALSYQWDAGQNCSSGGLNQQGEPIWSCAQFWRQRGLSNNSGYRIRFSFQQEANPTSGLPDAAWHTRTGATFHNDAVAASPVRTVSYATPSAGVTDITTDGDLTWRITRDSNLYVIGIRRPGSATNDISVTYSAPASGVVSSIAVDGVTTNYSRNVSGSAATMTVTNALNQQTVVVSDLNIGRPTSITDALNRTTSAQYDGAGRVTRITAPEGNYTELIYDARGNVIQNVRTAKPNSGEATITTNASFPATCVNLVTCNRALSTTDARGNTTDYSYDQTHGGVLTVTAPAVTVGGAAVRPQVRTSYAQVNGVLLPTQVSACRTSASCIGTADETRTDTAYGANHLPSAVSSGSGSGSLTATSAMTWDSAGNLLTVDGPLAGAGDTVRYRYDAARRRIGTVSPDPDGVGPLPPRAIRTTYRPDGQVSKIEIGIVNGPSDGDWAGMIAVEREDVAFDSNTRPVLVTRSGGGPVVQTSYDGLGRAECVALRMDPATWASLPMACTPIGQGSHGPDRITRAVRNAAGEVTQVRTAVGTPLEAAESTATYTNNGRLLTLTDGEGNRTSYDYDGHDRLRRTYLPLAAQGANASNAVDFEELGYDAASNVVTRRNRAGETAAYTVDALGRIVVKNLPGIEPDVTYGYDQLGRLISASQPGHALIFTYDALGRQTGETGPLGTVARTYDAAGNRIQLEHPDGAQFAEWRDLLGRVTLIGAPYDGTNDWIVARYWYDYHGRRTATVRGADVNGTTTGYYYDGASRLTTIAHDLGGAAHDLTLGFSYNPASQIASQSRSNDLYSFAGAAAGTTNSAVNGLNQLTLDGSAAPSHDARGNLINDGAGRTFVYDSENRLISHTSPDGTVALAYDPLGRLYSMTSGSTTRRFLYDGLRLISEHDGTSLVPLRRYVHGPGTDEPAAYFEGGGLGLSERTYPHQDERGSIVAIANADGTLAAANRYDEYGAADGTPSGRFGYTGQVRLPALGLYYYRARMYDPRLGRFLQPDPIGYGDGMNMYAYVGGDPVNRRDPSGLGCVHDGPDTEVFIDVCAPSPERPEPYPSIANSSVGARDCPEVSSVTLLCAVGEAGGGGGGGEGRMSDEEREAAREADERICRMVRTRECWASVAERDAARVSGRPIPPLRTGVRSGWSGRDIVAGVGVVAVVGGLICLLLEPCGAIVAGVLTIGGSAAVVAH